jgi:hypothetical protein
MPALLFTHTNIDGGSIEREVTDEAVIAYGFPPESFAEIILTDAAKCLIDVKNSSLCIGVIIYTL